jgi:hypothetical protein
MTIPTHCGMPPLTQNIEGLRLHALMVGMFMPEPEVSPAMRKWRSWLIHCLVKTARHYGEARSYVQQQINEARRPPEQMAGGRALPILDFAFAMEDCITSLEKVVVCMRELEKKGLAPGGRVLALEAERKALNDLRRQQEHMHTQIAKGETGSGPIFVTVSEDGERLRLRKESMSFSGLHRLVDAAYRDLAAMFPGHDVESAPTAPGVPGISITATMTVVEPGTPHPRGR